MMNPFKLALCLAIPFALAACSGGGGELTIPAIPTIPVEVSLKPLPTQPSAPEQPGGTPPKSETPPEDETPETGGTAQPASGPPKFFPLKADHLTRMNLMLLYPHGRKIDQRPAGTTLDSLLPSTATDINIPQFSVFDFGDAQTLNGIPVQQATAEQADRYAAYAYQAILEHSTHIFQAGLHHYENVESAFQEFGSVPYFAAFSTGKRAWLTEGSPGIYGVRNPPAVDGRWKGKAYGIEYGVGEHPLPTIESVATRLVMADATITARIPSASSNPEIDIDFRNWQGGSATRADKYRQLNIGNSPAWGPYEGKVVFVAPRSDFEGIDRDSAGIDLHRSKGQFRTA